MAGPGTLSTQQLRISRGSGGLTPSTIPISAVGAGSRGALNINPGAGSRTFTPAPIPQAIKDQTSDAILEFMGTAVTAVQGYQQREAEYLANEAALSYTAQLREAYDGHQKSDGTWVPGYSALQGDQTRVGWNLFQGGAEVAMAEMLSDMEPRVKQRAIIKLQSAKNQYLGKAATHRATEMQKAIEAQRYQKVKEIGFQVAADPFMIDYVDPDLRSTMRQRFYSLFTDQKQADEAWFDLMVGSGVKIYYDIALQEAGTLAEEAQHYSAAAEAFNYAYDKVFEAELAGSLDHQNKLQGIIKTANHQARVGRNSQFTREQAEASAAVENMQDRNESDALVEKNRRHIYTPAEVADKMAMNPSRWSNSFAKWYTTEHHSDVLNAPSPLVIAEQMNYMDRAKANGWNHPGTDDPLRAGYYYGMDGLNGGGVEKLDQYYKMLRDPNASGELSLVLDRVRIATSGPSHFRGIFSQDLKEYTHAAEKFVRDNFATLGAEKVEQEALEFYNRPSTEINLQNEIAPSQWYTEIYKETDLITAIAAVKEAKATNKITSEEEYLSEMARIEMFTQLFEAKKAFLEKLGRRQRNRP